KFKYGYGYLCRRTAFPAPSPVDEKDALARPFFGADITQAPCPFNKDKVGGRVSGVLSTAHVAEKPRFRHERQVLINHPGLGSARNALFRTVLRWIRRIGAPGWRLRRGDATYVSDRQCWVGAID